MSAIRIVKAAACITLLTPLFSFSMPGVALAGCSSAASAGVDWQGCRKRNLIISGSDLSDGKMAGSDLSSSDIRDSNVAGADFTKSNLMRATLAGSKGANAIFQKTIGYRTDFSGSDLSGSDFTKSELQRANFSNSNLSGANFFKADMGRAVFDGTTLTDNNFEFANLSRINFTTAKIEGALKLKNAYVLQTNFSGVDLSSTSGLAQWQLDMSCGDSATKLPDGLTTPSSWPCSEED